MTEAAQKEQDNGKKPHFSKFPPHFQTNLVKLIISDRLFAAQMQEVLELSYFEDDYLKIMVENIFKYKDKYGTHPGTEAVDMIFSPIELKNVDPIKKQQITNLWQNFQKNKKVEDHEYYMKLALDYCRSQKIKQAIVKNINDLDEANIDNFMDVLTKAAALGNSQNFGHDYVEDFEKRYEKDLRETITLGDPVADEYTNGGIARGEVFVYVAPRSKGKTSRMVRTSCKNLQIGNNVVYFHMEMLSEEIGQKFDACLAELHLSKLKENKEVIRQKLEDLPGKLKIIEEDYGTTTPRRIFNKVRKLEDSGFRVDLIVIDYMDICSPTKVMRDDDGSIGGIQVYAEVKNYAKKFGYRVLTGAQTNRKGNEAEIITSEHFEGRIARFNPCDFVVGFSSFGKASPLKTRVGEDGWVLDEERDFGKVYTKLYKQGDNDIDQVAQKLNNSKNAPKKSLAATLHSFINKEKDKL